MTNGPDDLYLAVQMNTSGPANEPYLVVRGEPVGWAKDADEAAALIRRDSQSNNDDQTYTLV